MLCVHNIHLLLRRLTKFQDDPEQRYRSEDAIIAYTWKWVIDRILVGEEPDRDIVLRCPMTKVRCDVIHEHWMCTMS